MSNKIPFTADDAITLEMLNSFVRDSQIEHLGNGEISLMSKAAIQNALATKADKSNFTKFIFNEEGVTSLIDGYTYYGCKINHTISSGTYYFYNCTGTLTVSGNSAKIYATSCPELTINGKTDKNWTNIWMNGVADNSNAGQSGYAVRYLDGTQICAEQNLGSYGGANYTREVYFPIAFAPSYMPQVATYAYMTDTGYYDAYKYIVQSGNISNTKFTAYIIIVSAENVNRFGYIAIGRWK